VTGKIPAGEVTAAQLVPEPVLRLRGRILLKLAWCVRFTIRHQQRHDGIPLDADLLQLHHLLRHTAEQYRRMSDVGQQLPTSAPVRGDSPHAPPEQLTAAEAAFILGCSDRHVRRLADQIGTIRRRPLIMFDRSAVEAYAARRQAQRRAA
jgi:hypothetical protein